MSRHQAFEDQPERYDQWFNRYHWAYLSELLALRAFIPWQGRGVELGVGSGRFAAPLGIGAGIDPSPSLIAYAQQRGVDAVLGVAERLPWREGTFDHALLVTAICFLDDAEAALAEAHRVLRPGGRLVIGFVDRLSELGQAYEARREQSAFYSEATFYSVAEVAALLRGAGFSGLEYGQTLATPPHSLTGIEPLRPGSDTGSFMVVSAGA